MDVTYHGEVCADGIKTPVVTETDHLEAGFTP